MSLFDKEFFPTPKEIIIRMAAPYADRLTTACILEPSAGSGAILDTLLEGIPMTITMKDGRAYTIEQKPKKEKIWCVERNPELQLLLQKKGYRLVADDFLDYQPDIRYDLILMNPCFSKGDQHLLHAWDILRSGDIACLLNAETVRNPYTATRKQLAAIIKANGSVEDLGKCFRTADNPTDVDVVLVRLHKEARDDAFTLDLSDFAEETAPDFGELASSGNAVMQSNRLDAFLRAWDMTKSAAITYIKAREALQLYLSAFINAKDFRMTNIVAELDKHLDETLSLSKTGNERHIKEGYNHFVTSAKREAWNMIFNQIGLGKYMTTGLREKLSAYQEAQSSFALTKENIMKLFSYIMTNIGTIMDNAVVEVYDMFTRFYKENTSWKEGWKTNKQFRCNRKVVLPGIAYCGFEPQKYGYSEYFSAGYRQTCTLDDIDKAMCWLSGRSFDTLTGTVSVPGQGDTPCPENSTLEQTLRRIRVGDQDWHESAFFRIRAFKKGTVHIEFKDESLWARFNVTVNDGKNQLGDTEAA